MTTGKFVTDTDLTFLGNIYLCHLEDARGQFVADGDGKLLAFHLGIEQLVLLQIVDHELGYKLVLVVV